MICETQAASIESQVSRFLYITEATKKSYLSSGSFFLGFHFLNGRHYSTSYPKRWEGGFLASPIPGGMWGGLLQIQPQRWDVQILSSSRTSTLDGILHIYILI